MHRRRLCARAVGRQFTTQGWAPCARTNCLRCVSEAQILRAAPASHWLSQASLVGCEQYTAAFGHQATGSFPFAASPSTGQSTPSPLLAPVWTLARNTNVYGSFQAQTIASLLKSSFRQYLPGLNVVALQFSQAILFGERSHCTALGRSIERLYVRSISCCFVLIRERPLSYNSRKERSRGSTDGCRL